jgi:hypothetical protein
MQMRRSRTIAPVNNPYNCLTVSGNLEGRARNKAIITNVICFRKIRITLYLGFLDSDLKKSIVLPVKGSVQFVDGLRTGGIGNGN